MTVHPPLSRRGFTLIELLVVLAIMATFAALALSGLFRTKDANRLLAAEHLLADAVRQARHTARSSGAPVELRLTSVTDGSQVVGARLAGVSRTPIFHESFDPRDPGTGEPAMSIGRPGAAYDDLGQTLGRSGIGRLVGPGPGAPPVPPATPPPIDPPPPYPSLPPIDAGHPSLLADQRLLARGATQNGFYLSCAVRLPLANAMPDPVTTDVKIPLVLVGPPDSSAIATSQCGLALWLYGRSVTTPGGASYAVRTWELRGWVFGEAAMSPAIEVSSISDPPADQAGDREPLEDAQPDIASPIPGGTWEEFGLLYDGERLVLYRNGQRVGVQTSDVPLALHRLPSARVWIGQLGDPGTAGGELYAGWPVVNGSVLPGAALDDVRLDRLGTEQLGELPQGIVLIPAVRQSPSATLAYRILAHPDGRVEVLKDGDPLPLNARAIDAPGQPPRANGLMAAGTITVAQRLALDGARSATLTVGIDGRVDSMLFTAP
jgi:prepilin-type N-terminal cleavage/methylation domain-containing protein